MDLSAVAGLGAAQQVQAVNPTGLRALMNAGGEQAGDFWSLLFESLQMMDGESGTLPEGLLELLPQTGKKADEDEDTLAQMMQMLAEGTLQPNVAAFAEQLMPELMMRQDAQAAAQQIAALDLTAQQPETAQAPPMQQALTEAARLFETAALPDGKAEDNRTFPGQEAEILAAGQPVQLSDGTEGTARESFYTSIHKARQAIQADGQQAQNNGKLDVEKLQQDVDAGRYSVSFSDRMQQAAAVKETEAGLEPKDIMAQVKQGIVDNLKSGKNEFVVKLKPEGLGEITVKMIASGGKIAMNIIASSTHTAQLLNQEIAGLRESLRPLGAEVSQVVSQQEQNAGAFHQQQQGGFNFAGHEHRQFTGRPWQEDWAQEAEEELDEAYAEAPSVLNAYV